MIELLKGVAVSLRPFHFLDQGDDGNARFQSLGERRDQQCRRRTVLRGNDGDFSRLPRIAVRHRAAHVFLPIGKLANADRLAGQDYGRRQALAENDLDAVPPERLRDALRNSLQPILFHQFSSVSRPLFSSRKRSKVEPIKSTSVPPIGVDRQAAAPFGRLIPAA